MKTVYCPRCDCIMDHWNTGNWRCYRCGFFSEGKPRRFRIVEFDFRLLCLTAIGLAIVIKGCVS